MDGTRVHRVKRRDSRDERDLEGAEAARGGIRISIIEGDAGRQVSKRFY